MAKFRIVIDLEAPAHTANYWRNRVDDIVIDPIPIDMEHKILGMRCEEHKEESELLPHH